MIDLTTGTPGAKKTAFNVSRADKLERSNSINIIKNKAIFAKNKPIFDKYKQDFSIYTTTVGGAHTIKNQHDILPSDYFDFLLQDYTDLRPDYYFLRTTRYNEIMELVSDREGGLSYDALLPVRTIYSNINGLKIPFVRSLDELFNDNADLDWRLAPDGSVIIIDEIQLVSPFSEVKSKNNDIVQDLTIHRHRGFDFWIITQAPSLLHPTIKELVSTHYHLTVPYGMTTRVYQFGSTRAYPNTATNKHNCEAKFSFKPPARIFNLYKSTTINTAKARIPWKPILFFSTFVLAAIVLFIYSVSDTSKSTLINHDKQLTTTASVVPDATTTAAVVPDATTTTAAAPDATTTAAAVAAEQQALLDKYLPSQVVELTKNELITPVSVVSMGNRCMAFNKYNERINIDIAVCRSLLDIGGMPKLRTVSASASVVPSASVSTPSAVFP